MKTRSIVAIALALGLSAAVPDIHSALAAGSGGGGGGGGNKSAGGNSSIDSDYGNAVALVNAGHYEAAIELFQKVLASSPDNADALNEMGFSYRKLGQTSQALSYYQRALDLEPNHVGANEYMGELYLELKDLPKAEQRLAVLKAACGNCEEYGELKEKIEAYRKTASNG
jgi:tetratricopeptide (TPR) repeat protein